MARPLPLQFSARQACFQQLLSNSSTDILRLLETECYTAVSESLLHRVVRYTPQHLTNRMLCALTPRHVRELNLTRCSQISLMGLVQALKQCSNVHHLILNLCPQLICADIFTFMSLIQLPITHLSLEQTQNLEDNMVHMAIQLLPHLTTLNISENSKLTDEVFLVDPDQQILKEICIQDGSAVDPQYNYSLTSVDVSGNRSITMVSMLHLGSLCGPRLKFVNLSWTGVESSGLLFLAGYNCMGVIDMLMQQREVWTAGTQQQDLTNVYYLVELATDLKHILETKHAANAHQVQAQSQSEDHKDVQDTTSTVCDITENHTSTSGAEERHGSSHVNIPSAEQKPGTSSTPKTLGCGNRNNSESSTVTTDTEKMTVNTEMSKVDAECSSADTESSTVDSEDDDESLRVDILGVEELVNLVSIDDNDDDDDDIDDDDDDDDESDIFAALVDMNNICDTNKEAIPSPREHTQDLESINNTCDTHVEIIPKPSEHTQSLGIVNYSCDTHENNTPKSSEHVQNFGIVNDSCDTHENPTAEPSQSLQVCHEERAESKREPDQGQSHPSRSKVKSCLRDPQSESPHLHVAELHVDGDILTVDLLDLDQDLTIVASEDLDHNMSSLESTDLDQNLSSLGSADQDHMASIASTDIDQNMSSFASTDPDQNMSYVKNVAMAREEAFTKCQDLEKTQSATKCPNQNLASIKCPVCDMELIKNKLAEINLTVGRDDSDGGNGQCVKAGADIWENEAPDRTEQFNDRLDKNISCISSINDVMELEGEICRADNIGKTLNERVEVRRDYTETSHIGDTTRHLSDIQCEIEELSEEGNKVCLLETAKGFRGVEVLKETGVVKGNEATVDAGMNVDISKSNMDNKVDLIEDKEDKETEVNKSEVENKAELVDNKVDHETENNKSEVEKKAEHLEETVANKSEIVNKVELYEKNEINKSELENKVDQVEETELNNREVENKAENKEDKADMEAEVDEDKEDETEVDQDDTKPVLRVFQPSLVSLDIQSIKFRSQTEGAFCLRALLEANTSLQKLCISWKGLSGDLMQDLVPNLTELREIELVECTMLDSAGLIALGQGCSKLSKVNLTEVHFFKDYAISPILCLPGLSSLSLAGSEVSDLSLERLASKQAESLRELDLSWCEENFTDKGINAVCQKCTNLRVLNLRKCPVSDMSLRLLSESCTKLTDLSLECIDDFNSNESVIDHGLMSVAEHLVNLQTLDISWNITITDTAVTAILTRCVHLENAIMNGIKTITVAPFLPIIADMQGDEDTVTDGDGGYPGETICTRSSLYAPCLRVLELEYCDLVDEAQLLEIVHACRGMLNVTDYYGQKVCSDSDS